MAPPILENIPLELRQRRQWVCWALEERNGRATKVPYTPGTTKKARANSPSTWNTLEQAYASYLANPNFFAGIGYEFTKDDPYVGVDFDHCIDNEGVLSKFARDYMPYSYAEISQSGRGVKAIVKATITEGRKTPTVEMYSERRFFALTGNILAGMPRQILEDQEAIDKLLEVIGESQSEDLKPGKPGAGGRAARVKAIPDELWQAGRNERRTNINKLLSDLRRSAVSRKTGKADTMLAYLLEKDYEGFHAKWPHVGIKRGDGSFDNSQIRAVMASSIKGRGFVFPEFVALMSYFFGAECSAKWGTRQGVQEEFATLWFLGRSPRTDEYVAQPAAPVGRGRAGNRTNLLERAYEALVSFKAGTEAILTIADLAEAVGVKPRTASDLISELASGGRIARRKSGQYGGIVVTFTADMQIEKNETGDIGHTDNGNGHIQETAIDATYEILHVSEAQQAQNQVDDFGSQGAGNAQARPGAMGAEPPPHIDIYINTPSCVSSALDLRVSKTCKPNIDNLVAEAFDTLPRDRVNERTGILTKWPITDKRILEYVHAAYPGRWGDAAILCRIELVRKRRKNATFDELKGLKREALEKRASALRKRIERAERQAQAHPMPEVREWYRKQAAQLVGQQSLLAWELGRRDEADTQRIAEQGYSPGEQQEMLDLVEETRVPSAAGLIARLKARVQ